MVNNINILAIETSCDDTSASIISDKSIVSNVISSQDIHNNYGGIVPELASREHVQNITHIVAGTLQNAQIPKNALSAIAFTQGPGLLGSLIIGTLYAKSFALALNIPLIAVNHMKAHIMANFIEEPHPKFPFLCLTVSGGHTQIVQANSPYEFSLLGKTLDDAVGEAFDKIAKMLNLGYPGGPLIDKLAMSGNSNAFKFSVTNMSGYNFSFSGIKTAFKYFLNRQLSDDANFVNNNICDLCAGIQECLVDTLLTKVIQAVHQTGIKSVALAGGVASNSRLRCKLDNLKDELGIDVFYPRPIYCTDNAAMVAICAHYQYLAGDFATYNTNVNPNLNI